MNALKLAKAHLRLLEAHRKSGAVVEAEMVKRADAILKGKAIDFPSVRMVVRSEAVSA